MSTAPAPFTPSECDLRGMPYMPLDVVRLFDSDFYALSNGDEFKAGLSLWGKAFLQVPAGSLPDDDRILAHLSGAGPKWCKVKEMALRGWIKCEDGRLYHATVAEKVAEAWQARVDRRARTEAARAAKLAAKHGLNGSQPPPSVAMSVTEPVAMSVTDNVTTLVAQSVTGSKGSTREGKGREEERKKGSELRSDAEAASRSELWRNGPAIVRELTGIPERRSRAVLGRVLSQAGDDCAGVLGILADAVRDQPVDPVPWLMAAAKARKRPAFRNGFFQVIADEGMPSTDHDPPDDNPVTAFIAGYGHGPH